MVEEKLRSANVISVADEEDDVYSVFLRPFFSSCFCHDNGHQSTPPFILFCLGRPASLKTSRVTDSALSVRDDVA